MGEHVRRTTTILMLAALAAAGLASAGCNIAAPVFFAVHGPPRVEAVHTLDESRRHVIFIDDRASNLPRRSYRMLIGQTAEETLIARGKLEGDLTIPSRLAAATAAQERHDAPRSIVDIGLSLDADVVIYADIRGFALSRDGSGISPAALLHVKIIDVENNSREWPVDQPFYPLTVQMERSPGMVPNDRAATAQLEQALSQRIGLELARLFFSYERGSRTGRTF